MTYIFYIALLFMMVGVALAAIRFLKGPTAGDRSVALDTLTTFMVHHRKPLS